MAGISGANNSGKLLNGCASNLSSQVSGVGGGGGFSGGGVEGVRGASGKGKGFGAVGGGGGRARGGIGGARGQGSGVCSDSSYNEGFGAEGGMGGAVGDAVGGGGDGGGGGGGGFRHGDGFGADGGGNSYRSLIYAIILIPKNHHSENCSALKESVTFEKHGNNKIAMTGVDQTLMMVEDKVPYLNGDNYKSWREAVLLHLGCIDLDYALRKEEPLTPTNTSTQAEIALYEQWERSNRLSIMFIKSHIMSSIRGSIPECENVKDLMDAIHAQFETSDKALGSTLMSRLTSMKLTSIKAYNTQKAKWSINELLTICVQEEERLLQEVNEIAHLVTKIRSGREKGFLDQRKPMGSECSIYLGNKMPSRVEAEEQPVVQQSPQETIDTTLRRSTRIKKSVVPTDYVVYMQESDCDIGVEDDLNTFIQAIDSSKSKLWYNAMINEMNSMMDNKV
ncbi:uncharacterized protein LOC116113315 [Pistacia vera]|uniref:uncharacterized protein LOC116113315 n=1 Tax=Pistacia vera TaxID=55513 RepID=UPI001263BC1C|nr:uncharacterized protein LOC116113315 [Pistacia vera]